MLQQTPFTNVRLLPGLFKERADVNTAYLKSLSNQGLLQNFYLEAGIIIPGLQVIEDPENALLHWGWEAPVCQLRGHFLGHWLSASSMIVASEGERELKAKIDTIIDELAHCQELNGGEWIASIPEKYFTKLEKKQNIWSPQYVMHKTVMGLFHAYVYAQNEQALHVVSRLADWFMRWTEAVQKTNPHAVYSGEEGGMLEMWAALYEKTKDKKYMTLALRYSEPSLFTKLLNGQDALSACHANASIPFAHGAAKMYEVTGEQKWLDITNAFWDCAVRKRESYCTGGQNAGEYWIPPHQLGGFLGERNQEFCTVYNMVRLAEYLFRFTNSSEYGDYIEKNLYNGFLAQQNKQTGVPTYFLPLSAESHKKWGTKTRDFWCCYGTMVQAQALYPALCYYTTTDSLIVAQYIPSKAVLTVNSAAVTITQTTDMKYYNSQAFFDDTDKSQMSRWLLKFTIQTQNVPSVFTLKFRVPSWIASAPVLTLNGEKINTDDSDIPYIDNADSSAMKQTQVFVKDDFLSIRKEWKDDEVTLFLPPALSVSTLCDMDGKGAVLEGPIVLAHTNAQNGSCMLRVKNGRAQNLSPVTEHTYSTFPWVQSHYRVNGENNATLVPLYDVTDETYTVYLPLSNSKESS